VRTRLIVVILCCGCFAAGLAAGRRPAPRPADAGAGLTTWWGPAEAPAPWSHPDEWEVYLIAQLGPADRPEYWAWFRDLGHPEYRSMMRVRPDLYRDYEAGRRARVYRPRPADTAVAPAPREAPVRNHGVDVERLNAERDGYGPGFVAPKAKTGELPPNR
jgi:hypothetical protein